MARDTTSLVRYVARLTPWRGIAATAAAAAAITWVRASQVDDGVELVSLLRVSSVLLAAVVATCVEDGSEPLAATSRVGRPRRRLVAVTLATSAAVAAWLAVALVGQVVVGRGGLRDEAIEGLLVELVALCATACALATATIAITGWRGSGTRAAVGMPLAVLVSLGYPRTMEWFWPPPGPGPEWQDAHVRWMFVGVGALVLAAWLSRDTAARPLRLVGTARR